MVIFKCFHVPEAKPILWEVGRARRSSEQISFRESRVGVQPLKASSMAVFIFSKVGASLSKFFSLPFLNFEAAVRISFIISTLSIVWI